jgi:hypothetical protein
VPDVVKEEVLCEGPDWGGMHIFPVTLITYSNGSMDLHRQTGERFHEDWDIGRDVLRSRGLDVDDNDKGSYGSSGFYQRVIPCGSQPKGEK